MKITVTRRSRNLGYAWSQTSDPGDEWRGPSITGTYKTIAAESVKRHRENYTNHTFQYAYFVNGHRITRDQWDDIVSLNEHGQPGDTITIDTGE